MSKHRRQGPRESKREQFVQPASSIAGVSWNAVIIAAALVFVGVAVYVTGTRSAADGLAGAAIFAASQDVTLPAAEADDGRARFYRYASATGRDVRFFVMKSADGVVRAAFDACDVCFRERRGYRQSGDFMVCNNCGQSFRSVDINVLRGGCNPAPLDRVVENDRIVIRAASLESGASYF